MKKQLIMIGIVIFPVCIGLSGCNGNNILPPSEISTSELKLYPEKYVNTTIKIKGVYSLYTYPRFDPINSSNSSLIYMDLVTDNNGALQLDFSKIKKPGVQIGNIYYFTGKFVKHTRLSGEPFDYWLEVTNVESVS